MTRISKQARELLTYAVKSPAEDDGDNEANGEQEGQQDHFDMQNQEEGRRS